MALSDGNGWVECACGSRHWGRHGAAGLLLVSGSGGVAVARGAALPAEALVLLQHRAGWSHEGGTWGVPGGARDSHEDVVTTALRETLEETGIDASSAALHGVHRTDHSTWEYSTVIMHVDERRAPRGNRESEEVVWVPVSQVPDRLLHPAFEAAWPVLSGPRVRLVVDVADVVTRWPGAWGREPALAAQRLVTAMRPLVGTASGPGGELIALAVPVVSGPGALAGSTDPAVLVTTAAGAEGAAGFIAATAGAGDLVVTGDASLHEAAAAQGAAVATPDWLIGSLG